MKDRTAIALSSLEFGPGALVDAHWLHGSSESLARLRRRCEATADAGCRVIVITGPTGVGKHRLARWIHRRMLGPAAPWAVLPATGLPGALGDHPGMMVVEDAQACDAHAARMLCERIERSTSSATILIVAGPLAPLRSKSEHHERLFGRLTEAVLDIPGLDERPEDIDAIARAGLETACERYGLPTLALSPGALEALQRHPWPGNAHQINVFLERAALGAEGRWITPEDLGLAQPQAEAGGALHVRLPGASLREIEIKAITLALELADNRIVRAAELLGITRHALRRKIDKFGVALRPDDVPDPEASI